MVTERHRLRGLQVGEAGHHRVGMLLRPRQQRVLQRDKRHADLVDRIAHPQAKVGRDLVVAAARGVETAGDRADPVGEPRLGQHVDVFQRQVVRHAVCRVIGGDLVEPGGDRRGIVGRDDPLPAEHRDMRLRSGDVLAPHPLVEGQAGVYLAHHRSRAFGEPTAPHRIGLPHVVPRRDRLSPGPGGRGLR